MAQTVITLANGDKQIVITGAETWAIPSDWNDAANKFEAYGGGGNGATGTASISGGGGGGGSYQKLVNFPLKRLSQTPNSTDGQPLVILSAIDTAVQYTLFTTLIDALDGVTTYGPGVTANRGSAGVGGGAGGSAPSASFTVLEATPTDVFSTVVFAGGNGGAGRSASTAAGGGGGGAAGPNGAGGNGGSNTSTLSTTGRGGGGGNGGTAGSSTSATGGTAGTGAGAGGNGGAASTSGSAGGAGTNVATTYIFSGGGGGGAGDGTTTTSGGAGGLYGAGGGGGASSTISTGGLGSIGAMVITYTPVVAAVNSNFFLLF
jgi:hypothetical protein